MSIFPDCLKGYCGSVMRWCEPCFFSSLILWDSTWHTQHNGRRACCASPLHMGQSIMGCHNSSHHRREETEGARAGRSSQEHVPQQGPTSDILPPPSCTVLFWVHQGIDPSIRSQSHDVVTCGNTLTNTRGSVLHQSPRCPLIQPSLQLSSFGGFVIHRWPLGKTVVNTQKEKLSSPGAPIHEDKCIVGTTQDRVTDYLHSLEKGMWWPLLRDRLIQKEETDVITM